MAIITGNTKIEKHEYQDHDIYFKREDMNPSGSFKDRLIDYLWPRLQDLKETEIVLSSSGNLAISLLYYQIHSEEPLTQKIRIFINNDLPESKMGRLRRLSDKAGAEIIMSGRPKSDCFKYSQADSVFWLRNSEGADYPNAFHRLSGEILKYEDDEQMKFDGVVVCTSSGTAIVGVMEEFLAAERKLPVYAVQTSHVNSIAKEFDDDFKNEEETLANAISDRIAKRKHEVVTLLKQLEGSAVVVENNEIRVANEALEKLVDDQFTGNAALSFAGFLKLAKKGYNLEKPLIIISGN